MNIDVSQDDAAVLNAIRQVRESTGFGRVVVEVKDGQIIFIGNSQETPIPPGLPPGFPPVAPPGTFVWLRCLHCGRRLVRVDVRDGRTCIPVDDVLVVDARLMCTCGTVRTFKGVSI